MRSYYVANGLGNHIDDPTVEEMRTFLDAIDVTDEEHGAAWLGTESGPGLLGLEPESEVGEKLRVPWHALMDVAGECLTLDGALDPPRRRTTGWPSANQVARLRSCTVNGG
jgi:hypothetical protein